MPPRAPVALLAGMNAPTPGISRAAALECRSVSVSFGPVAALSDISLAFEPGLIHAVVGQNGAGKTTFARVAAGLVTPEAGMVLIDGRPVAVGSVRNARGAGVELVHQSFALPPSFTVAEALEFGACARAPLFTAGGLGGRWKPHLDALGIPADPHARIRDLPVETQQGVEIARALVTDARVLILDEPTAVLSPSGIGKLFTRVRSLKERGVTVILILHKIREVLAVADTVSILRGGRLVAATLPVAQVKPAELARQIIGPAMGSTSAGGPLEAADAQAIVGAAPAPVPEQATHRPADARPVLSLEGVATRRDAEGPPLEGVMLSIRPGEIVGVAGVEGNGQRTLVRSLAGLAELAAGGIELDGRRVDALPLADRRGLGLRIIPFERNSEGLSLSSSLWENWAARRLLGGRLLAPVNPARLRRESDAALKEWGVRYSSAGQKAGSLSGGNAQKVILARELDRQARLIVAAQPTRGLDVGATAFVWRALRDARDRGCGILLISSDLDELFDISDRVAVMLSGRIAAVFEKPFDVDAVGAAMTGAAMAVGAEEAAA